MADLLECLIQVKALRETLGMVTPGDSATTSPDAGSVTASGVWHRMAEAERRYAAALGTDGPAEPGRTSAARAAAGEMAEFVRWRRANLYVLERCSAARLAGPVEWPGRRSTTVADLVAIMLASDTDVLGALRRVRSNPESGVT
jgi:hypothetical protein